MSPPVRLSAARRLGNSFYERLTGFANCLPLMQTSQWHRREDLQQIQFQLMKSIVQYAAHQVPYYAGLFGGHRISPEEIRDIADFARIPVSTKSMMRPAYPSRLYSRKSWLDLKTETSGSTGEPFESIVDGRSHSWRLAAKYLFDSWMGIAPGETWLRIRETPERNMYERLTANLFRAEHWVQLTKALTSKSELLVLANWIDQNKPSGLFGPASALALLAKHIQDAGAMPSREVKGAYSTMETLLTHQKDLISSVFGTNLFNRYGLREFGGYVAQDCEEHVGLHVNPFLAYAEVVRDDGTAADRGEVGRLILTDLRNYAMPFIRYDTGDLATINDECLCGRGFPSLGRIIGRESDYILTKFGLVPSLTVTDDFGVNFVKHVQAFQLVQNENGKVIAKVVPTTAFDQRFEKEASRFLSNLFDEYAVEIVREIEPEPSGKRSAFKSSRGSDPT